MMTPDASQGLPWCIVPALATVLCCISILVHLTRQGRKTGSVRLLGIICLMMSAMSVICLGDNVHDSIRVHDAVKRFLFPFTFFLVPMCIHLSHEVKGLRTDERRHDVLYGLAILLVAGSWWMDSLPGLLFPYVAFAGVLSSAYVLAGPRFEKTHAGGSSGEWFVFAGIGGLLLLISLQFLGLDPMRPPSFAFIPVALLAFGVARSDRGPRGTPITTGGVLRSLIAASMVLPLVADLILIAWNWEQITLEGYLSNVLSFGLAKILAVVVCTSMALFIFTRRTNHTNNTLLSVICMLLAIFNLKGAVIPLLPEGLTLQVDLLHNAFTALAIGTSVHLVYRIARRESRMAVTAGYAASGMFLLLIALYPAISSRAGIGPLYEMWRTALAGGILLAFSYCAVTLLMVFRNETDPQRKDGLKIFFMGSALGVFLQSLGLLSTVGIVSTLLETLLVVPLMLIIYGLTYKDLLNMSITSRRKMLSLGLKTILIVAYLTMSPVFVWLWHEYPVEFILGKVIPYGIPPLLSFLCAAFLSLFVLGLEQSRPEAILFSLINFCYALLNLDVLLVTIVPDMSLALKISRLDHFFLSLIMLGVNIHLIYLVIGMKKQWWVVYASYLIGLVMAPLSQTRYYYQGMYTYFWGYFAHKAILFDVMSILWLAGLVYGIYLLHREFTKTRATQRTKVRRVLTAFMIMAALSMSNIPTINGYEVYPLGTFAFIGLVYLAYGLFKFNMRLALQYVRSILFGGGIVLMVLAMALIPGRVLGIHDHTVALLSGVLLVISLLRPLRRGYNAVIDLFIPNERDELNEEYVRFTENLSHAYHLRDIHDELKQWFFRVYTCSFFTLLVRREGQESFRGWNTWNSQITEGLFRKADEIPRGEQRMVVEPGHALARITARIGGMTTGDVLSKLVSELDPEERENDIFAYCEIMLPISLGDGKGLAVLILGVKNDGSPYRTTEMDIVQSIALVLGPTIENALLLESLEDQVEKRTSDLNAALAQAMVKEKQIVERNVVIERQNQIMAVLLQTSSGLHTIEGIEELFGFSLSQLRSLFPDFSGGIILEDIKRNILEASAFAGMSEAEQKVVLDCRGRFEEPGVEDLLNAGMASAAGGLGGADGVKWKVNPFQGGQEKAAGYMVLREADLEGPSGETIRLFMAQISAVVQNRLLLKHLERMASTDGLTGVYNRAFLDREIDKAIRHARRFRDMSFSLMVIDVNGLKQINDTYGHGVGDEVIVKVSSMLRAACRETDIVSRIGGDEFAVLMPSTSRSQAEMLKSRIREGEKGLRVLLTPTKGAHINIRIHISIGLASSDESDPEQVMKTADDLMYLDKQLYYKRLNSPTGHTRQ